MTNKNDNDGDCCRVRAVRKLVIAMKWRGIMGLFVLKVVLMVVRVPNFMATTRVKMATLTM